MIYGSFDTDGKPIGFYISEINGDNIPAGAVEISNEDYYAYLHEQGQWVRDSGTGQRVANPLVSVEQTTIAQMVIAVQEHLDAQARALDYDNIFTAVTYADEPAVPEYQAEGLALRAWRSHVWQTCYQVMQEVKAGTRAQPTKAELIAALPQFSMS